jgi:CPA1 family monovalent cation:H+ antiporter
MRLLDLIAVLLVLVALLSYLNHRWLKLPPSIGLMALTLCGSVGVVVIGRGLPSVVEQVKTFVHQLHFDEAVLHGMLGFLLFAGALHINLNEVTQWKIPIALLATLGVLLSTVLVGVMLWGVLFLLSIDMRFGYCLVFGALIAPTDPIAILGLLKQFGAPRPLEVTIAGEALLNDGVGVVVFLSLLQIASAPSDFQPSTFPLLLLWEAGGGVLFGLAIGLLAYALIKSVDNYRVEILLSLALVAGGYALAEHLHLSAPLAMVVAGLLIGNQGRRLAMSATTVERLDLVWELIDEILNAMLFVLLGLEVLILSFTGRLIAAGALAVGIVLLARLASVGLPAWLLRRWQAVDRYPVMLLTWGGLRGGISVAMALSVPSQVDGETVPERDIILVITYMVVVFSILVQGLTMGPLVRRLLTAAPSGRTPANRKETVP